MSERVIFCNSRNSQQMAFFKDFSIRTYRDFYKKGTLLGISGQTIETPYNERANFCERVIKCRMRTEIVTLNTHRIALERAENSAQLLTGAATAAALLGIPGGCLTAWLTAPGMLWEIFGLGILGVATLVGAAWWHRRRAAEAFAKLKAVARLVQSGGDVVFVRPAGLHDVLDAAAAPPADAQAIDFDRITAQQLVDRLHGGAPP